MKKSFKRFLSSVLATVMAVASMSIGMTSTAMAGTGNYSFSGLSVLTAHAYDGKDPDKITADVVVSPEGSANTVTAKATSSKALCYVNYVGNSKGYLTSASDKGVLAGTVFTDAIITQSTNSSSQPILTISDVEAGATVGVYFFGSDSKGATGKASTINVSDGLVTTALSATTSDKAAPAYGEITATQAGEVTIYGGSGRSGIAAVTVSTGSADPVITYTWKLDTNSLVNVDGTKLSLGKDTTTDKNNTLTYSGSDYTLNDEYKDVTGEPDADNVITVTPEDSWFTEVVPATAIADKATLTFDSFVGTGTEASEVVLSDYFTIIPRSGSAIEKNSYTFDGLGDYTSRYKTGGKSALTDSVPSSGAIKFATADAGVLQVAVRASGNGERTLSVYDSTGAEIGSVTSTDTNGRILNVTLPKADTYYIAATNGYTVYSVNVVVGESITSVDTTKSVFTDTNDAYVIAKVSSNDVVAGNTLVMSSDGQEAVESDVVYKGAIIDGQYVTAEEIGADFIYVVKAVGAKLENVANVLVSIVTAQ